MKSFISISLILITSLSFSQSNPEPFLAELTTEFPNVRDLAISPNGNEVMFTAQSVMGNLSTIITSKKVNNNNWTTPAIVSFSGQFFDLEPFYSSDGLKVYFVSTRPLSNDALEPKDFDIWFVERISLDSNWSEAKNMGPPINTKHGEFYPSITNNGNFYFTRDNPEFKTKDDIYVSIFKNDAYQTPKKLGNAINTEGYEYNAFISPDESYLLFGSYNRKDGFGSGDLYISFKTEDQWTVAKNLGDIINSDKMDYCPFVDTKTNTLYFTSKRDNTKVQQEKPLTTEEFITELNKVDNGSSSLYRVFIDELFNKR